MSSRPDRADGPAAVDGSTVRAAGGLHGPGGQRLPIPGWVVAPLAIGLASRLFSVVVIAALRLQGPPRFPLLTGVTNVFSAWDGQWYLRIAERGYHAVPVVPPHGFDYAFYPLWPILIRIAAPGPIPTWVAGVALANGFFVLAAVLVWRLLADVFDPSTATRATALLAFAPPAFVFSLIYTESLFVFLAAAALLGMRRGSWWAIPAAFLVALTRVTALAVAIAAAVAATRRSGRRRRVALVSIVAIGIATLAWAGYNARLTGDWLAFIRSGAGWVPGTTGLPALARELGRLSPSQVPRLAFVAAIAVASVRLLWVDLELGAFAVACMVLGIGFGAVWSMPRYALVAFPAFGVVARWSGRRGSIALVILSIALEVAFAWMSINPHPLQGI